MWRARFRPSHSSEDAPRSWRTGAGGWTAGRRSRPSRPCSGISRRPCRPRDWKGAWPMFDSKLAAHVRPRVEYLWDAWAFAALEAQLALDQWKAAARDLKASAFRSYRAALDREERAAVRLAEACA